MSNTFNLTPEANSPQTETETDTEDAPGIPGINRPSVDVAYPDGTSESVDPEYDIIITQNPREDLDAPLDTTAVTRLEIAEWNIAGGMIDKHHVRKDVQSALAEYRAERGYPPLDICIDCVYTRTIGDETTVCVLLRSHKDNGPERSQLALLIDEWIRTEK